MKVRVGYAGTALAGVGGREFAGFVDALEDLGFDSLWLSERMSAPRLDVVSALAFAAARTTHLKLGSSVSVLPGRNPAEVAKTWATLDVLSDGRALPAFGLGVPDPHEQQAFGVRREERAARFDEMLPLVRRIWAEESVDHHGEFFTCDDLRVEPKPTKRLDVWLGGKATSELRRIGRLGDGWLASFTTPSICAASRAVIDEAAAGAGRGVDPEHFGAIVAYALEPLPDSMLAVLASRSPGTDPADLVVVGHDELRRRCEDYVAVGFSKLVPVCLSPVAVWPSELAAVAAASLDLQT